MQRASVPGLPRTQLSQRVDPYRDLIGADDPGVGVLQRHGSGFGPGQARRQGQGPLAGATASRRLPARLQEKGRPSLASSSRRYFEVEAKISGGGDFKNNDLHPILFDRGGNRPYYTRPMASGLPDRVDCAHLADDAVVLERVYPLGEMPRLQDLLADARGSVRANSHLRKSSRAARAPPSRWRRRPQLVCQRCLQGFAYAGGRRAARLNFASELESGGACGGSPREIYATDEGLVSLRELAEEELLLALPLVASCSTPQTCGRAPARGEARRRAATNAAVCRIAGFVEENLIGQSTHGSSKKQKNPLQARHASLPLGACRCPRCRSTPRAARLIRGIAFPAMGFTAARRCCRPRRTRQRPKNKPYNAGGDSRTARV